MQSKILAEPNSGETITTLKQWAAKFQLAICGSYIATENDQFYNRAFFLTPEGEEFYYDKRHLFRMGREAEHFSVGDKRLIIPPIMDGISACWFAMISVFLYGAGT